ncbi:ParB/RepB/Spo0J family partition protein [Azospirillum sp. CT11-132]|jgi:ParB family chromosome partitioning protein|uniref:ParB/RepB/Spo0J family partition protein n=1 Tax=unclassified Azospirillum TaxID=2630922 RepID=UPI000D61E3D1|nr:MULTISPECIES: ParB/RepB/Spo0J family partition protein [unclassified Azospirillum]PWC63606.1 chromosome partitioning protein ParB [Azospirillum sp. TSH7]PWC67973.1 chromosome partitioning protein ParB [Azospirillum sp. TSH20]QCG97554.1 ParB/RepB/Spo0J family partition protein [Azospirillum sp. TSA2s]
MIDDTKQGGARRASLGRGLSALFGEATEDYSALDKVRQSKQVPIEFVHPGKYQPRRKFDEEAIQGLVDSIRDKGILQPLLVRRDGEDANSYELIAGERRWRAAQIAGLHEVPVVIRDLSDREALEIALIENIQRQDLTPLEEAEGYRRLMEEFEHTQEDLARAVGKSRSHVANMMRLLALPDPVKSMVQDGALTAGHARALLTAPDPAAVAREVVTRGLNVRQTEDLMRGDQPKAKKGKAANGGSGNAPAMKDVDLINLEEEISARIGLKVAINPQGQRGTITIHYQTLDQLDDVLHRLGGEE